jgi:deoxyribonuclease-4
MIKLGAHLSISGGHYKAISRIQEIGGNCLQIFSASPRGWNFAKLDETQIKLFVENKKNSGIDPIYFHASYLVNLADAERVGNFSKQSLINELNLAPQMGVKGSIVHLGSYKTEATPEKYQTLIKNIKEILEKTDERSLFMIENAGNRKIGQTIEEIGQIIKDVGSDRVKVCLDTCHLFSNGYDLRSDKQLEELLFKFDKLVGIARLELWHLNDSRDPLKSGRDRHENIGQGTIGLDEFKVLLNHPKTKEHPFIIETPGFDGNGPDKKNLDILKSLA